MGSTSDRASSSNNGFFQSMPIIPNQYYDDISLQRIIRLFLPQVVATNVDPDLSKFGQEVLSKRVLDWVTDAEKNVPYLRGSGRDAFGRRTSELIVSEGWKRLQNYGIEEGIVACGYEDSFGESTRVVQFLKLHVWTGSCGNVACPSAMSDGAAKLLSKHLSSKGLDSASRGIVQNAYDRLTSRNAENGWTSGQWMTERSGGSDVSGTETLATYIPDTVTKSGSQLGPWKIDGFKWFSSATDSSMAILLAQTPKGLSTFFAPMHLTVSSDSETPSAGEKTLNGVFISRLKNKFGTKSLPTAELELSGMRGYLIGKEGHGIQEISTILNITRLYSAVSAVGYLGRGLAIAKAFAKLREVGAGKGKKVLLKDAPLHMSTLANITTGYHAMMLFTFFVSWLMGISEHGQYSGTSDNARSTMGSRFRLENASDAHLLLRLLTPILKASVCKRSIHALQECMEALGGVGYLDNNETEVINISRLYRDCCVLSIWEGTTDVLASDMLRVIKGHSGVKAMDALDRWILKVLNGTGRNAPDSHIQKKLISQRWITIRKELAIDTAGNLLPQSRELLFKIANILMGVLFIIDSQSDQDIATREMCSKFLGQNLGLQPEIQQARNITELHQKIVYGNKDNNSSAIAAKL